jgi:hypothetical protein
VRLLVARGVGRRRLRALIIAKLLRERSESDDDDDDADEGGDLKRLARAAVARRGLRRRRVKRAALVGKFRERTAA